VSSVADLLPHLKSAYVMHRSTEMAVVKVLMDILFAVNAGNLSVLTLLNLCATFDIVNHDILLTWLKVSE